ncbi:alpha/beta fold hydrolase [Mycolicibacterium fortuitum]|uniref:alpha/beta fold hydrolase n=1 Tax=Mycolicibacterium fortuitum TaxID=1766 RepID=UPI0026250F03|nr:alpha/beta fold hydrolase [Mycolicibacterium fortuitum]
MQELRLPTKLGLLRVEVRGAGDAIVFWPSLLMTGGMWAAQAQEFETDHRVILVDPPGHGGSEKLFAPFTFTDCAHTVADILDGVGVERAHFVGNSWGGMIGGTFAALHPDRIGRAVLMNCTASAAGRAQKFEYGLLLRLARAFGGIRGPLTRADMTVLDGVAHLAALENPRLVNTLIRDFLARG